MEPGAGGAVPGDASWDARDSKISCVGRSFSRLLLSLVGLGWESFQPCPSSGLAPFRALAVWRQEMSIHPVLMLSKRPWAHPLCSLGLFPRV